MSFQPIQVLFAPTYECNLRCIHCCVPHYKKTLNIGRSIIFLHDCFRLGLKEIGFTGGEPFLFLEFIVALSQEAEKLGVRFDRITTNAGWFKNRTLLENVLSRVLAAGFTGTFCVSVDGFHKVSLCKIGQFVTTAVNAAGRPDAVSLVYVGHIEKIKALAQYLGGKITSGPRLVVEQNDTFVGLSAKIVKIPLCPIGQAQTLKNPWGRKWLKEDYCQGPGQVLYVTPAGDIKPCCGFASDLPEMTIGNIYTHRLKDVLSRARQDVYLRFIYERGLLPLKELYERQTGEKIKPTLDHCFLCWHLQKKGIRKVL